MAGPGWMDTSQNRNASASSQRNGATLGLTHAVVALVKPNDAGAATIVFWSWNASSRAKLLPGSAADSCARVAVRPALNVCVRKVASAASGRAERADVRRQATLGTAQTRNSRASRAAADRASHTFERRDVADGAPRYWTCRVTSASAERPSVR